MVLYTNFIGIDIGKFNFAVNDMDQNRCTLKDPEFNQIVLSTYRKIDKLTVTENNFLEYMAPKLTKAVYSEYYPNHRSAELIVVVPSIIALFREEGIKWLENNLPELYSYYVNTFNPKLTQEANKILACHC